MNPDPEKTAKLFERAAELPPDERRPFLAEACGEDVALRKRVEALLLASEAQLGFLPGDDDSESAPTKVAPPTGEVSGSAVGNYKLLEKLGEGGFGAVWAAEQKEPVRRRVALKLIKLGMDTRQVIARFEAERQALALMDHPNIAKVLDAGATETGRPYFVMELVRGITITKYCEQENLGTRDRLELFIKVCQAIQHAHQKGIIHRDIKPSNVMITLHDGEPVPKVIDFGIAKATQADLTDKTIYTHYDQFIGTPAYMSPEQAEMSGLDIDTRADIYSLGVLLYELLCGTTPFDGRELLNSGVDEMRKIIREREPLRPSTKLSQTLNDARQAKDKRSSQAEDAKRLRTQERVTDIRGDLDWVVMKCLEKDRNRRYETANGLAADIRRHIANEPVEARPPSAAYRFQKAWRRNKVAYTAGALVIAALVFGLSVASVALRKAISSRKNAVANEAKAMSAQASEASLRQQAEQDELTARQRAYASDMNVAQQALAGNNLGRALDLLNRQRPRPGQKDLRGWEWRYLWDQTHSDALFELCQKSEVESLSVSADGTLVAIGLVHRDGLFVYDLQTRQEVAHLAPGESRVRAAFSPVGSLLAFATQTVSPSKDKQFTLHLWNTATRQMVAEIPLSSVATGLVFSRDGRRLMTSTTWSGEITVWQIPEGKKQESYPLPRPDIAPSTGFAATPDLRLAAYWTAGGWIHVLDVHDRRELWKQNASDSIITALAFSPDGKTLASAAGYRESDIRLWDVASGHEIGRLEGHENWVGSLVFWPDGNKLASSSADQTIRTWDVANRRCLDVLHGHRQEVWRLALLPDNRTLVSGCKDGTVCVWDTSAAHPRTSGITLADKTLAWSFTPDSRSVVTLNRDGKVMRRSLVGFDHEENLLDVGDLARTLPVIPGVTLSCCLLSPDCRYLTMGSAHGTITIWDLFQRSLWLECKVGEGIVTPLAFRARGTRLICHSAPVNRLFEWDLETNREIQQWQATPAFFGFGQSPDEQLGIAVGWHGFVQGRNLPSQENVILSPGFDAPEGIAVSFSPDGNLLAIASARWQSRMSAA